MKDINETIKFEILEERLKEINKCILGSNLEFSIKEEQNGIFGYTIYTTNIFTKEIMTSRTIINKYAVLEYICGLERGIALMV